MVTRVVHRVRCRKKDNKQVWADVKVVDGFTVQTPGPSGTPMMLWTRAKDAQPFIIDHTGDGNGKGSAQSANRVSHMEQYAATDDPRQKMDVEILDACSFMPPTIGDADGAGYQDDVTPRHGLPRPATFGRGPFALLIPEKEAVKYTVDNVGLGLDEGSKDKASRSGHVNLVTEKGNTDDKNAGLESDSIPPTKQSWVATVIPDGINFRVPGGDITILIPKGKQEEDDTTKMTTDPDTGEPCPPDNTDPNIYVYFPTADNPGFPSTGTNLKIPKGPDGNQKPINQGPLWWIEKISPSFRPWFWFAKVQAPKAFSFFGSPGRLGNWAWRGFVLWNNYPVIWILSRNNAIVPMGTFGSGSLDLCARIGSWDFAFPPVPSRSFLAPGRPDGSTVQFPFSALPAAGSIEGGGPFPNAPGPFGPFGILQMTHPPLGKPPDGVPYDLYGFGNLWDGIPTIWQLTGLEQPQRVDPTKVFDAFTNPYPPPNSKLAEQCANTFRDNWNAVANGHNSFIEAYVPGGGVNNGGPSYGHGAPGPPGWAWAVPWYDNAIGAHDAGFPGEGYRSAFNNGIPPGVATLGLPLEVYSPATAWTLDVDQLDPAIWDCTHLEVYSNPINFFFPLIAPPFLWTADPWIGTA